jgi:hypothetical protein
MEMGFGSLLEMVVPNQLPIAQMEQFGPMEPTLLLVSVEKGRL